MGSVSASTSPNGTSGCGASSVGGVTGSVGSPSPSSNSSAIGKSINSGGNRSSCLGVLITSLALAPTAPCSISLNISEVLLNPDIRIARPADLKKFAILPRIPLALGGISGLKFLDLNISAIACST